MSKKLFSVKELCYIALFAAVIALSSWIAIPAAVSFTLQTFAVFCTVGLLGTKCGVAAVITYVLLGAVGFPVFSGFTGGIGVFATVNGGFIIGFIPAALICGILIKRLGKKPFSLVIAMASGLIVCYVFGAVRFSVLHKASIFASLSGCILPYIPFDIIKTALAVITVRKFKKFI